MSQKKHFRVNAGPASPEGGRILPRRSMLAPGQSPPPPPEEASPALDARRLERAYVYQYRVAQQSHGCPSRYAPPPAVGRAGTWRRVAGKLRAGGIDPVRYVTTLIRELRNRILFVDDRVAASRGFERPPSPDQLDCAEMRALYAEAVGRCRWVARLDLDIQKNIASGRIAYLQYGGKRSMPEALVLTLMASKLEISPLFRHGLATSEIAVPAPTPEHELNNAKYKRAADRFFERACMQFATSPEAYLAEWRPLVSPAVEREAGPLYYRVLDELEI